MISPNTCEAHLLHLSFSTHSLKGLVHRIRRVVLSYTLLMHDPVSGESAVAGRKSGFGWDQATSRQLMVVACILWDTRVDASVVVLRDRPMIAAVGWDGIKSSERDKKKAQKDGEKKIKKKAGRERKGKEGKAVDSAELPKPHQCGLSSGAPRSSRISHLITSFNSSGCMIYSPPVHKHFIYCLISIGSHSFIVYQLTTSHSFTYKNSHPDEALDRDTQECKGRFDAT